MLLQELRPDGHGRDAQADAFAMVTPPDRNMQQRSHRRHRPQIALPGIGWVVRDAVKQGHGRIPLGPYDVERVHYLWEVAHPGGDEHRLALTRDVGEEGQIRDLSGWDFKCGNAEAIEEVGTAFVERRREKHQMALSRVPAQLLKDLMRENQGAGHLELSLVRSGH